MSFASVARTAFLSLVVLGIGIAACSGEGDDAPASSGDVPPAARTPNDEKPATPVVDGGGVAPDGSVVVSHERELRGAWIATVHNSTWPSKTGLDQATAKAELVKILDALQEARLNTIFFQVRTESDALYASTIEPWSRWITGKQGQDPGWDPLSFAIDEGHRRGLEVHAWLNPYRGIASTQSDIAPNHITKMLPSAAVAWGPGLWMDPGVPEVRAHILDVIRDILMRYDVDGIHFDDYFYPYPEAGSTFNDAASFSKYTAAGGMLGKDDWRRDNVNKLVAEVWSEVAKTRADARFGISPFGIYRPGTPPGITGLDAYAAIYCDPLAWMNAGTVDYLAPQLYWPTTQTAQAFGKLVTWWGSIAKNSRSIFIGHDATRAGEGPFTISEYGTEIDLVRAERPHGVLGSIFWSASPLVSDKAGLRTALAQKHYTSPAAPPPFAVASENIKSGKEIPPGPPLVMGEVKHVTVQVTPSSSMPSSSTASSTPIRSIAVYRASGAGGFVLDRLVPAKADPATPDRQSIELDPGRFAISLIDRRGVESRATTVTVE